jgi:hypothetical protein
VSAIAVSFAGLLDPVAMAFHKGEASPDRLEESVPKKLLEMRLLGQRPRYQEGPPEGAGCVW